MTSWPKDLKPAHFDALTIPIVKAIEDANYHERRCEEVDIEWKGLPYTLKCLKVSCLDPEKTLKAKNLERRLEDGINTPAGNSCHRNPHGHRTGLPHSTR